jgi:hypothetical protein
MIKGLMTVILSLGLLAGGAAAEDTLAGYDGTPAGAPELRPETLFQGDLVAEMGLGCSNGAGTSGGPNDIIVGVAAAAAPPLDITNHYYEVFTQYSPTITALSFIVHSGGTSPGGEIGRQSGLDWSQGPHTVALAVNIGTNIFHFGHNQPQATVGMRWGLDTSSGSAQTSYIRAPSCGANVYTLVDALGFAGNWCMSATIGDTTPVELQSWGSMKALYQ